MPESKGEDEIRRPNPPMFAVIVPTFNRAQELPRALQSILSQSFGDFEVIVVDDGSTDETPDILEGHEDERLTVVHQRNAGACTARNTGVAAATATYVTFLDSDDEAKAGWLATFARLLPRRGSGLASLGAEIIGPKGEASIRVPEVGGAAFGRAPALFLCGTFAIDRVRFLQVGGYADGLVYSENTDLRLRLAPLVDSGALAVFSSSEVGVRVHQRVPIYDPRRRYDSAVELLDRNQERLGKQPDLLATYQSIAGVSASRLGEHAEAIRFLRAAVRGNPADVRHSARLLRAAFAAARTRLGRAPSRHGTAMRGDR